MGEMSSELQTVLLYLSAFFMVFLSFVVFSLCLRVLLWIYMQYYKRLRAHNRSDVRDDRMSGQHYPIRLESDRQGNIFTIANEAPNNTLPHRCSDFFYVDPAAEDAARIRAQLEKDEKDLPTYEQVMAMSVAQTAAGTLAPYTASNTSIATTDTTVPPYSEIDRSVIHPAATANGTSSAIPLQTLNVGATVGGPIGNATAATGAASTSRAAAAAATSTPITVVTIANSVSNTSV
ncbi:PREDICTED: uncharacterized protein LOC108361632 isoform X1 [Rhagoletis zephyria]|uniref:uncharacterized protein LOC108361632 isoform X1 n=1 Tax=Rhagoletis zephyria TaxID=28612 RepID=UPI00081137FD|nr:PREDICTED: uncharacterized protein LOC108361632 isoform X1 [Rhagoletis zephyria]